MAHIGKSDKDWANHRGYTPAEDLFFCEECDLDFALESNEISGKTVHCPICKKITVQYARKR